MRASGIGFGRRLLLSRPGMKIAPASRSTRSSVSVTASVKRSPTVPQKGTIPSVQTSRLSSTTTSALSGRAKPRQRATQHRTLLMPSPSVQTSGRAGLPEPFGERGMARPSLASGNRGQKRPLLAGEHAEPLGARHRGVEERPRQHHVVLRRPGRDDGREL